MSRGLSRQQRAILGIAVHANRLTQGGTLAVKGYTTGASVSPACAAIVVHTGVTDLQWPLAAHLVKGLPFVEQATMIQRRNGTVQVAGNFFDLTTP